ncbi:molybdopterin molybdotransferase MoeA [Paenibacillus sp. D2_2]|uniref:molybdopterin molybdotransferase MoeA n=1 Tax=Paenibacillus sp. D2_2 TaxID=3073092 RepID=UPI00281620DB|nr:gephyrin-like molybdotransferase Glp [Paenibacillus sp. D2_2]WMT42967.1 molybdopterin molybdotransferase MoeA [Paenibacillus sp. D2_2]
MNNTVTTSDDKFRRHAVSVEEAQSRVMPYVVLGGTEQVKITESRGRILAEDVIAPHPYPFFRRSGMDGYAVISRDIENCTAEEPVLLQVIDNIPCGSLPSVPIVTGTAARIMTGAKVPDEADAVVMLEMTEQVIQDGITYIKLRRSVPVGNNITPIGFEIAAGDRLLEKGRKLSAGEVSVLATFGLASVPVAKRPRIAVLSTGSELLKVDEPLQDGKIRNSNTYMLATQIIDAGGEPHLLEAIPDQLDKARRIIEQALADYDVVITTGGVSVGDHDIMADMVKGPEVEMLFNKVTMRPGSVTTAAVKDGKLLFALSGNPGACFVGFELFVRPLIGGMLGREKPFLAEIEAELGSDYMKINNFTRFVRGRLDLSSGKVMAYPAKLDESSVMVTIKDSDVLIVIPPTTTGVQAGHQVKVLKLPGGGW